MHVVQHNSNSFGFVQVAPGVQPNHSVMVQPSQVSQASAFAGNNITNNPTVSGVGDILHRVPTPPIGSVPSAVPQAPLPTLAPTPAQVIHIMMYSNTSCDAYTQLRVKIVFVRIHVHRLYMYIKFCSTSCFLSSLDTHTRIHTHTHTHSLGSHCKASYKLHFNKCRGQSQYGLASWR